MKLIKWTLDSIKWIVTLTDRKLNIIAKILLAAAIIYLYKETKAYQEKKETDAKECDAKVEAVKANYSEVWEPVIKKMAKDDQNQSQVIDSLKNELQKLIEKTDREIKTFKR